MNWLNRFLFGNFDRTVRRKNARTLGWALLFALVFCLLIGGLLYLLNRQGRI